MSYFAAGGGLVTQHDFGNTNADPTAIFSVDEQGQLSVLTVIAAGAWSTPLPVSQPGLLKPGSHVAATRQPNRNQVILSVVDLNGQINIFFSVVGPGSQLDVSGPVKIGPTNIADPGAYCAIRSQTGLNQVDVFVVDRNGQLNVFWAGDDARWNGPGKIGLVNAGPPGAFLAASAQFGANQTDVFLIDTNGQLTCYSVVGAGPWSSGVKIGASGLADAGKPLAVSQQTGLNQTDLFLVDKSGQLNVFWVGATGNWNGPAKIGAAGSAPSGAFVATSARFGAQQTDAYLIDDAGQLICYSVVVSGPWGAAVEIGAPGQASPGAPISVTRQNPFDQTDVVFLDKSGQMNICWNGTSGPWHGPTIQAIAVPKPSSGLGGNSNYFFDNGCNNLRGVSVVVEVAQDIVVQSNGPPATGQSKVTGCTFQLNCYSPKSDESVWQQYLFGFDGTNIYAQINNWKFGKDMAPADGVQLINSETSLTAPPGGKIPAGYVLSLEIYNDDDTNRNVAHASFTVSNASGIIKQLTVDLTSLTKFGTTSKITSSDLAPIVAFEFNFVGPGNSESATLSSGTGTFIYMPSFIYPNAANLTVLSSEPSCVEASGWITAETANSFYGELCTTPSTRILQPFTISTTKTMIRKLGRLRPMLRAPDFAQKR